MRPTKHTHKLNPASPDIYTRLFAERANVLHTLLLLVYCARTAFVGRVYR